MVEVFKTNVCETYLANLLVGVLLQHFPGGEITFDLEDCDKILRVADAEVQTKKIIEVVRRHGFFCEVLAD